MKPLAPARMLLLKAADILEERGLAKRTQEDFMGRVCVHGALSLADTGHCYDMSNKHDDASEILADYLITTGIRPSLVGRRGCDLWNNQPERTKEEVVDALRAAAVHKVEGMS